MRAGAVCTLLRHVTERLARAGKYFALSPPVTVANRAAMNVRKKLEVWVNVMDIPAMETIRAATYWPARMMKVSDKWGTVTPGKYADIIASTR